MRIGGEDLSDELLEDSVGCWGLSAIEDLDIFSPAIEEKQGVLKVKLINYNDLKRKTKAR